MHDDLENPVEDAQSNVVTAHDRWDFSQGLESAIGSARNNLSKPQAR